MFAPIPGLIGDDSTPGGTSSSGRLQPRSLAAPKRSVDLGRGPAEAAVSGKQKIMRDWSFNPFLYFSCTFSNFRMLRDWLGELCCSRVWTLGVSAESLHDTLAWMPLLSALFCEE